MGISALSAGGEGLSRESGSLAACGVGPTSSQLLELVRVLLLISHMLCLTDSGLL